MGFWEKCFRMSLKGWAEFHWGVGFGLRLVTVVTKRTEGHRKRTWGEEEDLSDVKRF